MSKVLLVSMVVLIGAGSLLCAETPRKVTITWYGQACFLITTPQDSKILTDPIELKDYRVQKDVIPDVVTISHNHRDHDAVGTVSGSPEVIYGKSEVDVDPEQKSVPTNKMAKEVKIYDVGSYHFRPSINSTLNSIFVFEFDSLRIVHLGDLGLTLTPEQIEKIGRVDILMIPVGGEYTIWGASADSVVKQLKPTRAVIPMHFRTRVADFLPYTADDYVTGKANVERISGNKFTIDLNSPIDSLKYVVFDSFK
jgi:L-ascorbate metabolism protein UlaG (beta-lactamase superfamily)